MALNSQTLEIIIVNLFKLDQAIYCVIYFILIYVHISSKSRQCAGKVPDNGDLLKNAIAASKCHNKIYKIFWCIGFIF